MSFICSTETYCLGASEPWNTNKAPPLIEDHNRNIITSIEARYIPRMTLEAAQSKHIEVQNQITNCAILKTKIRTHTELINNNDISNGFREILKDLNKKLQEQTKENNCTSNLTSTPVKLQKSLLDGMTQEMCVYSYYLEYYASSTRENPGYTLGENIVPVTEITERIQKLDPETESARTKALNAFESSVLHFAQIEEVYPAHILLQYISIEMSKMRDTTAITLKAVVQTFLKALNAQTTNI